MPRPFSVGMVILLALMVALTGVPTGAESGTYFYVHDNGSPNEVHAFQLASDGSVLELPGSPYGIGAEGSNYTGMCQTLAYSQRGRLLFAASAAGIAVFKVARNGSLQLVPGSPFGGSRVIGVTAVQHKSRTFVYGATLDTNQVQGFRVTRGGGLTSVPGSPFAAGSGPAGMTHIGYSHRPFRNHDVVFTANQDGTISAYHIDDSGRLDEAPGSPFATGSSRINNVSTNGFFLYADDAVDSQVFAFFVAPTTAELIPLRGSPFDAEVPTGSGLIPGKRDLLVVLGEDTLQTFRISAQGGLRPLGGAQDAGIKGGIDAGAIDRTGRFLIVGSSRADLLRVFGVNPVTGVLTGVGTHHVLLADGRLSGVVFAR